MLKPLNVCLMNDSFPPLVDGVANCVVNYAEIIERSYGHSAVCTPYFPNTVDDYTYPVYRYPSVSMGTTGYRAGLPFSAKLMDTLRTQNFDVLHAHCPLMSGLLGRTLREQVKRPLILTYHTKFNIDIEKLVSLKSLQRTATRFIATNAQACDEVWVVSQGAGDNLRSLGYEGPVYLMENGVDLTRGRAKQEDIDALRASYHIDASTPVFIFVGRMMWYKGIRLILDGLRLLKAQGSAFKMLFLGDGLDKEEIISYTTQLELSDACIFVPAVRDRALLRVYYSLADLFLFPSDFDTNGIVVREAAACATPSLLLRGSCAAEGITKDVNGFLIDSDARALCQCAQAVCDNRAFAHTVGENAMNQIYLSWTDAVARAVERYHIVIENYAHATERKSLPIHKGDDFFKFMAFVCTNKKHVKKIKRRQYKPKKKKVFRVTSRRPKNPQSM